MKLVIQIPCLNEEATLPETIAELPTELPGIDTIELLIIDDGSSDRTRAVARECGVQHIVGFPQNRGLARAFMAGLDAALQVGADVIVNTDADNQYRGADIAQLVAPIVDGSADVVVGDRQVQSIAHFSATKKQLQRLGSWVVRQASHTAVVDATSGFRAFSREAAERLVVTSDFSYTLETLIQAGHARLAVRSVPVQTNAPTRESRLFRGIPQYLRESALTIVRIYALYKPMRTFFTAAALLLAGGLALMLRFLYYYIRGGGSAGHVQSLILAAILVILAATTAVSGMLADLIGANRAILEDIVRRLRRLERGGEPGAADAPQRPERP